MSNPLDFYGYQIQASKTDDYHCISIIFERNQLLKSRVHRINQFLSNCESLIAELETQPSNSDPMLGLKVEQLRTSLDKVNVDFIFLKQIYMALNKLVQNHQGSP